MTKTSSQIRAEYAPYDSYAEFEVGRADYVAGRYRNPYGTTGVAAQGWDRGSEFAMRCNALRLKGARD